jgi:cytochrome c oxidase cbb3-type subunit III
MRATGSLIFLLAAGAAAAQHTYTPSDIEDGGQMYRAICAGCHGPDGNNVPGIDLARGRLRRAATDDQMIAIIRGGIPGTAMPPGNFTEFQAGTIVAYLHSIGAANASGPTGDPARGKAIFERQGCKNCHRVRGEGSRQGPDLSDIGANRRAAEIEKSILDPDAEILPQNRMVRIVAKDGSVATGKLLNQDTFNVMILDSKDRMVAVPRAQMREMTFIEKSPMPSFEGKLNAQELADLVSYLSSLKNVEVK